METLTLQVAKSADDGAEKAAAEDTKAVSLKATSVNFAEGKSEAYSRFVARFPSVLLSPKITIESVTLELWTISNTSTKVTLGIIDVYNCAELKEETGNLARVEVKPITLTLTTVNGAWTKFEGGAYLGEVLGHLINGEIASTNPEEAAWKSGNAVGIQLNSVSSTKAFKFSTFDGLAEHAPKLVIVYSTSTVSSRSFSLSQGQVTQALKGTSFSRSVSQPQTLIPSPKSVGTTRSSFQGQTIARKMGITRTPQALSQGQVVKTQKTPSKSSLISQAQILSGGKSLGKTFKIPQIQNLTQTKTIQHLWEIVQQFQATHLSFNYIEKIGEHISIAIELITQGQSSSLKKRPGRTLLATQGQIPKVSTVKNLLREILISQGQTITNSKSVRRLLSSIQAQLSSLTVGRSNTHILTVVQEGVVSLRKSSGRQLIATQGQSVKGFKAFTQTLLVTQDQRTFVSRLYAIGRSFLIEQSQQIGISKTLERIPLKAIQSQVVVKFNKGFPIRLQVVQAQQARISRGFGKLLTVLQKQTPVLNHAAERLHVPIFGRLIRNANWEISVDLPQQEGVIVKGEPDIFVFRAKNPFPYPYRKRGTTKDPYWQ